LIVTFVTCNTRYMSKRRSQRREDLLEASIEYILENGVADLSLRPLAAAVGSKARLLVYHFGSKDALVAEAMIVIRNRAQQAFITVAQNAQATTPLDIMQVFWRWATTKQREPYLRLLFEVHGLALQEPAHYGRYLEGALTGWVELMAMVLPASLSQARRRALATLAVSAVLGLLLDYLSSGSRRRTSDALDLLAKNFDSFLKEG
jgi:AcrR family transcriptional regulator